MAQLWMDGFDHYGSPSISPLLDGVYAQVEGLGLSIDAPAEGARTGALCLKIRAQSNTNRIRRILGGSFDEIFVSFGLFLDALSGASNEVMPLNMKDSGNSSNVMSLFVGADGSLILKDTASAIVGTTSPIITASTWHHVECRIEVSTGSFEMRVEGVEVMNLSGLDLGILPMGNWLAGLVSIPTSSAPMYIDDLITRDNSGTFNNGFEGDLRVITLLPIANAAAQGWATRSVEKLGIGVLDLLDTSRDKALAYTNNASFDIQLNSYTMELFIRFNEIPSGGEEHTIVSQWREDDNAREYRLYLSGDGVGSNIVFEVSTLGTAASVVTLHDFPFTPLKNRWYHLAVSRNASLNRLFIGGQRTGVTVADANNYHTGDSDLMINALQGAGNNIALANTGTNSWVDVYRLTTGLFRYWDNFIPPTGPLPADVGGDPLYNNVDLLLNFDDETNPDQSLFSHVGTALNSAEVILPDDRLAYQTIDNIVPDDNNFVEADLVSATGTLSFLDNPSDTETVTLGSEVYTFQTVLTQVANNVLIGADAQESLDHLEAAVNLGGGGGTTYGSPTLINPDASFAPLPTVQLLATAKAPGAVGNAIVTLSTVTNGTWVTATLEGGEDIPGFSEFTMGALPPETTGLKSIAIIGRNFKLDSGTSQMQMSLVTALGGVAAGDDRPLSVNPIYYEDTIEQDPNTLGQLTPSTLSDAKVRLNRTQ